MPLFVIKHDAETVRILKSLHWRDRTVEEVIQKDKELYPPCLVMVEKPTAAGAKREIAFIVHTREFDVLGALRKAVMDRFVGFRKKDDQEVAPSEYFITKRGVDVLEPSKKKKEE